MCGIAGILDLRGEPVSGLRGELRLMNELLAHRGPDGEGMWCAGDEQAGLAHRRLSIIDLEATGNQPMVSPAGTVVSFNGEIYNYVELREALRDGWTFRTSSDTETILAAYDRYGTECVKHLRGMFAFALWDEANQRLLCARDRLGLKPFYYAVIGQRFYFASEVKALLPFLPEIETDMAALGEYLVFQYPLGQETLFKGVRQLSPAHQIVVENGQHRTSRYWDVHYDIDFDHSPAYFHRRTRELIDDAVRVHLRSDVPVGSYLSGGIDSSLVALLSSQHDAGDNGTYHGKFTCHPGYDESRYAAIVAKDAGKTLHQADITATDFLENIEKVIYHLDHPIAGPGSFPQYMVSKLAARHVKVVLGGQGGDEIFGGYARYLLAYFEQCLKAAIDGTYKNGNFVVTPESIIPNLGVLREYKPLIKMFWRDGLFETIDKRYFRLVDRSADMSSEVRWECFDKGIVFENFTKIFNSTRNVRHEAYFDSMTHFDLKCLLPALLHVEDRMSMAHGLESRLPFLDHPVIDFVATVPADVKFKDGRMKLLLKEAYGDVIPDALLERRDKMGFPVPLSEWLTDEISDFAHDLFHSEAAKTRPFINIEAVRAAMGNPKQFGRKLWGLISLEVWHRQFHDRASHYRALRRTDAAPRSRQDMENSMVGVTA